MPSFNRTIAWAVVVSLCALGLPVSAVRAELAATDRVEATRQDGSSGREFLRSLFSRADVRAALERQGVSADEAKARVDALSDEEVERLAARFDSLPAGGGVFETVLVVGFLAFLTLLITDILGFTKVFSFTRPAK